MAETLRTTLRVPVDGRFLGLVQGHVRELATVAGLEHKDVLALELAAEEALCNIRDHAFPDGAFGELLLTGEIGTRTLSLTFHDAGVPFDPALVPGPASRGGPDPAEPAGIGLKLIRHAADEVHWISCGREGKSLCLIKRLPRAVFPPPPREASPMPAAPPQSYTIRPLRPEDALQVGRLFWLAYGYSYREQIYTPDLLMAAIERGILTSVVAVAENGEVAGHAGLLRPNPVPMAEMAVLAVSPAHRGRGLMEALTRAVMAKATEMGLNGLSLNAVTTHAISQHEAAKAGAVPCGLDVATIAAPRFKALCLDEGPPQRETFLHCFQYLVPPPAAHETHVPARHRALVRRLYAGLGRVPGEPPAQGEEAGHYTVSFAADQRQGTIRVTRAKTRQWPELRRAAEDLADIAGAEVVRLDLPLAQAATTHLWERAEAAGFFFAGIWPHEAPDGDMARLIRLGVPYDLGHVQLFAAQARELAAAVGEEMERARKKSPTASPRIP